MSYMTDLQDLKVVMATVLGNSFLFPHSAVTEQHDHLFGVVFVFIDESKPKIPFILILVLTKYW